MNAFDKKACAPRAMTSLRGATDAMPMTKPAVINQIVVALTGQCPHCKRDAACSCVMCEIIGTKSSYGDNVTKLVCCPICCVPCGTGHWPTDAITLKEWTPPHGL